MPHISFQNIEHMFISIILSTFCVNVNKKFGNEVLARYLNFLHREIIPHPIHSIYS